MLVCVLFGRGSQETTKERGGVRQGREGRYSDAVMSRLTEWQGLSPLRTSEDGLDQASELSLLMHQDWQCSSTDSFLFATV